MPKRHRKMKKGGFLGFGESNSYDSGSTNYGSSDSGSGSSIFGSIGSTLSGWGSSISQGASNAWNKTKSATTSAYDSASGDTGDYGSSTSANDSYTGATPSYNSSPYGGRRKKSRKMRGGFKDNTPTTGIAAHASPISDIKSAQPHNWVGGKTKKQCGGKTKKRRGGKHRHSKSCKH
jgi:hypothetical protein